MKKSNTKSRIIMMARQGVKASEIADKVGTSVSYVYTVRKEMKDNDPEIKSKPLSAYELHLKNSLAQARLEQPRIRMQASASIADIVNSPAHYTAGGIETIDFIEAKKLGYNLGNVVKYITRSDLKGDRLENLKKAQWYLNREVNNMTKDSK
jgi:hypothetical protein